MAIRIRRGLKIDFDPSKLVEGEFAAQIDTQKIYYCFSPGNVKQLTTKEDVIEILNTSEEAYTALQQLISELEDETVLTGVLADLSSLKDDVAINKLDIATNTQDIEDNRTDVDEIKGRYIWFGDYEEWPD